MSKVKFQARWCKPWRTEFKIPKGFLLLKPIGTYKKNVFEFFKKLSVWQNKKSELRELDISIEVHYKKRTLDMNNLMWALYEIEANEMNGGFQDKGITKVLPIELYEADIREYAETLKYYCESKSMEMLKRKDMKIIEEKIIESDLREITIKKSTSMMNTVEHSEWINRQFRRLSIQGVHIEKAADVGLYWVEFVKEKNRLDDTGIYYTGKEIKERQPFCEACLISLVNGGGSLAHIKARGMGKHPMEGKYRESDVMHLCDPDHALFDNGIGVKNFLKEYPHLKTKIEKGIDLGYKKKYQGV